MYPFCAPPLAQSALCPFSFSEIGKRYDIGRFRLPPDYAIALLLRLAIPSSTNPPAISNACEPGSGAA